MDDLDYADRAPGTATAYVLLSGGIDSTTCLYQAFRDYGSVVGVSVDYGQCHKKEIKFAAESCDSLGLRHTILDLSSVVPKTMLTDKTVVVPDTSYAEIEGVSPMFVPFRNGLMLSALTAFAVGELREDEGAIYFGAHSEDARNWAYPDCTPEFIGAMSNAIYVGTYGKIRLHSPLEWLGKASIIALGQSLRVRWELTWSCYKGGDKHCGVCATCRSRRQGFIDAKVEDPTEYDTNPNH